MVETIVMTVGWIGSLLLAICAVPQALNAYHNEYCKLDKWFLRFWFWGEVFTLAYVLHRMDWPLVFNMVVNLICVVTIMRYNDNG